jgi:hypothetical protein
MYTTRSVHPGVMKWPTASVNAPAGEIIRGHRPSAVRSRGQALQEIDEGLVHDSWTLLLDEVSGADRWGAAA